MNHTRYMYMYVSDVIHRRVASEREGGEGDLFMYPKYMRIHLDMVSLKHIPPNFNLMYSKIHTSGHN